MPSIDTPVVSKTGVQPAGVVRSDAGGSLVSTDGYFTLLQVDANGALRVTGGGGGTEYTEDAAAAANPVGGAQILVRQDTPASEVSTNGDNIARRGTAYGAAYSQIVTSTGSFVDSFGGGTEYTEDAAAAANPLGKANILVRSDTPASEVSTNGDNIAQRGTAYGAAYCQILDSSGNFVNTFGGGSQYTEGDVDATITGTAMMMEGAGNTLVAAQGTAADGLLVNLGANNDVTIIAGATTIAKAEDAASADADVGVPSMAVRRASPANSSGTDGDYEFLQMSAGRLWTSATIDAALPAGTNAIGKLAANDGVDIGDVTINNASGGSAVNIQDGGNSITVDNAGTFATQLTTSTSSGNTTMQNAVSATGNGTSLTVTGYGTALITITGTFTATINFEASTDAGTTWFAISATQIGTSVIATTATTTGQYRINCAGLDLLRARVTWTSGTSVTAIGRATNASNSNKVFTVSTNSIAKAEDAASVDGDIGVPALAVRKATPANTSGTDGDYEFLQMSAGRLWVDPSGVTQTMAGVAAHDAAISGNPVRIAGRALTSDYTAVAAGDVADLITTLLGKLVTIPFANPNNTWNYAAASGGIVNTTGVTIKAAAGSGIRNYITCLSVINGHATVSTDVQIRDGASGTVIWRGFAQAAGGGVREVFNIPLRGTANTLLEVACGTTGAAVYVNVCGYTAAE